MPVLEWPDPPLRDAVVALRPWRGSDTEATVTAFTDDLLRRFSVPVVGPVTAAEIDAQRIAGERMRLAGEELHLAAVDRGDQAVVLGGASLYDVDRSSGRAAVGYWLTPDARGRGIATHATRLLARWAFDGLGVQRLELTCAPDNERSQAVAEHCGFTREGVLRSHLPFQGGRRDTVMFSLLAGELR